MSNLSTKRRKIILWTGLFILLITAAFFRLWRLHSIPPGLFGDEAADALDAFDVLEGRGQVFFPHNFGREGLHMWILAGVFKLMGVTPYAIRLPSAIAGIITVLAAYWLGYEMFIFPVRKTKDGWTWIRGWLIAWAAGMFTALSYWHIHFSRFGIRGVFTTTMAALTMATLWRAINRNDWRWWAISGLMMGIGAYFYTASRFIPLLVGLFLSGWILFTLAKVQLEINITDIRSFIINSVILFGVAAVVFAPLGYYFLTHPGSFMQRASEVSAFKEGENVNAWKAIIKGATLNLIQFIWPGRGDVVQFYNLPGRAVFSPLTSLLALLGLGVSLKQWRNPVYAFLVLWFLVMMSPAFLATDRAPTLPRVLGVIPGVFFFPAIGLATVLEWLHERLSPLSPKSKYAILSGMTALAFILPGVLTYRDYFLRWGPAPATAQAFESDMTTTWRWLEEHPTAGKVYVSGDIYRHLSFISLYSHTPTTQFFTRRDPNLYWFDARSSWPLPQPQSNPTIITGDSALPPAFIQNLLDIQLTPIGDGSAYLAKTYFYVERDAAIWFNDQLGLIEQVIIPPPAGADKGTILQIWRTTGPIPTEIDPYQIQSALAGPDGKQLVQVSEFMGIRPPEWEENGIFITWQTIPWPPQEQIASTVLRVVPLNKTPLQPPGSEDGGWVYRPLKTWDEFIAQTN